MMPSNRRVLLLVVATSSVIGAVTSFVTKTSTTHGMTRKETSLNAMPPLIIGPMIRKMREEKAKKKMPMIGEDEAKGQAPGLRVGGSAWKWPAIWPYDQDFFTPTEDIPKVEPSDGGMGGMVEMLSGVPQVPTTPDDSEASKIDVLDAVNYWSVEKANEKTNLDPDSIEKLTSHFDYYLTPGMSILELGAAEASYFPDGLNPSRHVGVGLNPKLMEENPSITEKLVVDLNVVIEDSDVDNEELRKLAVEPFDAIVMSNTIDFLQHPREVYRTAWSLLKPGGIMITAFSTKKVYNSKFERAQTKMWRDFNDDQHMWIAGSFHQFSAGDGWEELLGFDISPDTAKDNMKADGPLGMFQQGKDNNLYVVQAVKGFQDELIDEANLEKSIQSKMWMMPTLEDRDKQLVVPRLTRAYENHSDEAKKTAIANNIRYLPKIYEALIKMDQFAFTFQMQSQLAADLVLDTGFDGNEEQLLALRQGLGLRTPSPEFWQPVGETTADMVIEDKINLLSILVPRFGSGEAAQEESLTTFATGLKPTFALVRSKCPKMSESDVQLLGTELLCSEILFPGRSSKAEFAAWLGSMTQEDMEGLLSNRRVSNNSSKDAMESFRADREKEKKRVEDLRQRYNKQVREAREQRSMAFNPTTGKFQEINKDKKKK